MVEVFKTNVADRGIANQLIEKIQRTFDDYQANFDLDDCDLILRVQNTIGLVNPSPIIHLLHESGFNASVLPDELV